MAEGNYQVIFSGQIVDGADMDMVKNNVAKLFKLDAERLDKLFCGRRLILKKQIDQPTAEKYKTTMLRAGALCEIENTAVPARDVEANTSANETTSNVGSDVMAMAEVGVQLIAHASVPDANIDTGAMAMAEAGIQLGEHALVPDANIDTGAMDMAEVGIQLGEHAHVAEVEFDISAMTLDEVGVKLVTAKKVRSVDIDISHLSVD